MLAFLGFSQSIFCQGERILLFESYINVNEDGSMQVTENITVQSTGNEIKHGIYRDFPTRYKDRLGNNYVVDFKVIKVFKDNAPEDYFLKNLANGKRVYIGKKNILISPGKYTYTLIYNTNRQLGFFKDFDELYWNVTGNDWAFPIDRVEVTIKLPDGASKAILSTAGYTGPQGAQGKDFTSKVDPDRNIIFTSTKTLQAKEGLTLAISWPKGFVKEPDIETKTRYFIKDNRSVLIGVLGLLIITGYYLVLWILVGKDPAKGTIIPLYYPPEKLNPSALRYILKMNYDHKVFVSSVINMAVKGYLAISETNRVYKLKKTGNNQIDLSGEEKEIIRLLFGGNNTVELKNTNHRPINLAINSLKHLLQNKYEKTYFFTNIQYFIPGVILSLLVMVISVIFGDNNIEKLPIALFMSVWLTIWSFGVVGLARQVSNLWKRAFADKTNRVLFSIKAIPLTLFALPFFAGEIIGIGFLIYATSITISLLMLAMVFLNVLFYHLLKAPTLMGRKVMDKIEGFRMYLATAEKDRLKILNPLEKTSELFEKYLPYALALDVEQKWAEQFNDVFERAIASGQEYRPLWYSGTAWSTLGIAGFASGLGNSLSSVVSSSSTPPGSSGGSGGGGSSGGGGGGGGGGGW